MITAEELVQKLKAADMTFSCAESCTGGLLASAITSVAGASQVFNCSVVTYSNEAKERLLGVSSETLLMHGAVSPETAEEMAMGIQKLSGADVCISITGIAGPGGGSAEKPVGLVYIGCAVREQIRSERFLFAGNREEVRKQTVATALKLASDAVEGVI